MELPFSERLFGAILRKGNPCMVGLDPAVDKMHPALLFEHGIDPAQPNVGIDRAAGLILAHGRMVLEQVHDIVPIVKPQLAFFERWGAAGIRVLETLVAEARARGLLVLMDAKRGDIDATSEAYARAYLDPSSPLAGDAVTVSPYMGKETLVPYVNAARRHRGGVFVLVKTSNPGSKDLQELVLENGKKVYQHMAELFREPVEQGVTACGFSDVGFVIGATYPDEARELRRMFPSAWFLVPGFGAQGGGAEGVRACATPQGGGIIVNSSRQILFPHLYGDTSDDVAGAVRRAASTFREEVCGALGTSVPDR